MNYEEKYKEMKKRVLAIGQGYVKEVDYNSPRSIAEYIDPELRESEDEKIRKAIICGMNALKEQHKETFASIPINDCIAWLEKQGDKVDVLDDFPTEFERQISHLIASSINKEWEYKKDFVKHTANALLQYAKNELEKQGEQKPIDYNEELKKCRENPLYFFDKYVKIKEQKPAWSEEDVIMLKDIISGLEATKQLTYVHDEQGKSQMQDRINWLKSLKDRVRLQPKQEWSEEDEHCVELLLPIIDSSSLIPKNRKKCKEFLKSLKPNRWKPSEEQMKALNAINIFGELSYVGQGGTLVKLYNDLKKL